MVLLTQNKNGQRRTTDDHFVEDNFEIRGVYLGWGGVKPSAHFPFTSIPLIMTDLVAISI